MADETTTVIVPAGTVTQGTDALGSLAQYSDMKTAAEFIKARMDAHRAECQNVGQDPILTAALEEQLLAVEVIARWNDRRKETFAPRAPERRQSAGCRRLIRRQAE